MILVVMLIAMTASLLVWAAFTLGSQLVGDYRRRFTADVKFNMRELYMVADPVKLYGLNLVILHLVALAIWLTTGSIILATISSTIIGFLPWLIFRYLKKRRIEKIEEQLPDALQLFAGAIRAGLSLMGAIKQIATELPIPLSQEFQMMLQEQRLGVALDDSLENFTHRVPVQSINLMVSAMRISNETGGSLAETLERAAHTLRSQHAMERKIKALTAQGKMQAWVVGLLPVFLLYVLSKMEPDAMALLWTTRIGWGVIALVITLEFFGIWLIRKIVNIDV
jgi:tight adherence protein B